MQADACIVNLFVLCFILGVATASWVFCVFCWSCAESCKCRAFFIGFGDLQSLHELFSSCACRACVCFCLRFECVRRVCVICQCVSANVFGHCMHSFVFFVSCCVVFFKCMNVNLVSRLIAICVLWV